MSLVGNLEDLSLSDIFQIIFLSRRSGVLAIRGKYVEGKIYFKDGMVIAAYSTDISPAKKMISVSAKDAVFSLFIEEGNFDFELKDPDEEIKEKKPDSIFISEIGLNPQFLSMEGARLLDEARERAKSAPPPLVTEEIPPLPPVPEPSESFIEPQAPSAPPKKTEVIPAEQETVQPPVEGFSPSSIWAEAGITEEEHVEHVASSPGLALLRSMIFELQNPHSSSEITLMILRFASEIMNRAVLFIVKKDSVEGLGQFGVILKSGDPNRRIKGIKLKAADDSIFKEAILKKVTIKRQLEISPVHEYLVKELGGDWPNKIFLSPLLVNGRGAALLYGDNVPDEKPIWDTESLEIFLAQAGIAMEKALLERKLSMKEKAVK